MRVLATPLRPTSILLVLALALLASLAGCPALASALRRMGATLTLFLIGAVLVTGMAGLALTLTGVNPTPVLDIAPLGWALLGPLALVTGWRFSQLRALIAGRGLLVRSPGRAKGRVAQGLTFMSLASVVLTILIIGGRSLTHNSRTSRIELAYDLFEYAVPDQVLELASDECLMARVLEYGVNDKYDAGESAVAELNERGSSAVDGVASSLNFIRDHWPPEPNTIQPDAIVWGLDFLRKYNAQSKARRWDDIHWDNDLERLNSYRMRSGSWRY